MRLPSYRVVTRPGGGTLGGVFIVRDDGVILAPTEDACEIRIEKDHVRTITVTLMAERVELLEDADLHAELGQRWRKEG